jgi:hypothetical protein
LEALPSRRAAIVSENCRDAILNRRFAFAIVSRNWRASPRRGAAQPANATTDPTVNPMVGSLKAMASSNDRRLALGLEGRRGVMVMSSAACRFIHSLPTE